MFYTQNKDKPLAIMQIWVKKSIKFVASGNK